jgi:hypothetical protein
MDSHSGIYDEDLGEADGAYPARFGAVEQVTNYSSLVDKRCRPLIHWIRAASAYRMDRPSGM